MICHAFSVLDRKRKSMLRKLAEFVLSIELLFS